MIEIRVNDRAAADVSDFLVGTGQPALNVTIRTTPADAPLRWTIAPLNAVSGTVRPAEGTTRQFAFTPNVARARAGLQTGSRQPNAAVGYTITVVLTPPQGDPETVRVTFQQDEHSILRQEYVDFGGTPPARADLEAHNGNFNVGNYSLVVNLAEMERRFNGTVAAYRGRTIRVQGRDVRIPATAAVEVTSAYRNPRRNVAAGSRFPITSRHVQGHAIDMAPVTPVTVTLPAPAAAAAPGNRPNPPGNRPNAAPPARPQQVTLGLHTHLYPALLAAAQTQGTAITENGATPVPVGTTTEDHVHLQW